MYSALGYLTRLICLHDGHIQLNRNLKERLATSVFDLTPIQYNFTCERIHEQ